MSGSVTASRARPSSARSTSISGGVKPVNPVTHIRDGTGASLILSAAAFLIYVPLGYHVDRFFWKRRMAKAGRAMPPAGRR